MTSKFTLCFILCSFITGCSSKPEVKLPLRPWQRTALKGYQQTSIAAFGVKIIVRVWPKAGSNPVASLNSATTEISRVDHLTNPKSPDSEVSKINANAYQSALNISPELAAILIDCNRMYQVTEAKFDVTYVPYKSDKEFTEADINKITDWEKISRPTAQTVRLFGKQNMLYDPAPDRVRLYNRRTKLNLNGMIRGYAIDHAARLLATQGLAGFAIIYDGFAAVSGIALTDPGIMCIEDPNRLGACASRVKASDPSKTLFMGTSASLERRGEIYDPTNTWSYRSGGVIVIGDNGPWVQFATTISAIMDDGTLFSFFPSLSNPKLSRAYFDRDKKIQGSLAPFAMLN